MIGHKITTTLVKLAALGSVAILPCAGGLKITRRMDRQYNAFHQNLQKAAKALGQDSFIALHGHFEEQENKQLQLGPAKIPKSHQYGTTESPFSVGPIAGRPSATTLARQRTETDRLYEFYEEVRQRSENK